MWIHYTNSFNGVSAEYSIEDINSFINDNRLNGYYVSFYPVEYIVRFPENLAEPMDYLTKKYFHWFYESEFRLILNCNDNHINEHKTGEILKPKKLMLGYKLLENKSICNQIESLCKINNVKIGTVHKNMAIYNNESNISDYLKILSKIENNFKNPENNIYKTRDNFKIKSEEIEEMPPDYPNDNEESENYDDGYDSFWNR
nr:hypothetical protein GTC16762_31280 [Pigmentibacter ruber]